MDVVVLSDYGRDRIAYQGYDLLFEPELRVRAPPIGNRYVERIQAVYDCASLSAPVRLAPRHWDGPALSNPLCSSRWLRRPKALEKLVQLTYFLGSEVTYVHDSKA